MNTTPPTLEQWRKLYDLAARIKEMVPWEWMQEDDIFGVQDPVSKEINILSILGSLGEHLALSIYLGTDGARGLFQFVNNPDDPSEELFLETPQLQISFEDRDELDKEDHDIIKQLGLKFRGRMSWPYFRSYQPGMMPWFLNADEAQVLQTAMEQFIDVAERFRCDESLLYPDDEQLYLFRRPKNEKGHLIWEDHYELILIPINHDLPEIKLPNPLVKKINKAERVTNIIEVDLFMLPAPIGEKNTRPYFPYMLLIALAKEEMIVGQKILSPLPDLNTMRSSAVIGLFEILANEGVIPKGIMVQTDVMFQMLAPFCERWKIGLKKANQLMAINEARQSLELVLWGENV